MNSKSTNTKRRPFSFALQLAVYVPAPVTRFPGCCARHVLCWPAFPSTSALGSAGSAADCSTLFVGFPATMFPAATHRARLVRARFGQVAHRHRFDRTAFRRSLSNGKILVRMATRQRGRARARHTHARTGAHHRTNPRLRNQARRHHDSRCRLVGRGSD
jgi:hypothetical protein